MIHKYYYLKNFLFLLDSPEFETPKESCELSIFVLFFSFKAKKESYISLEILLI